MYNQDNGQSKKIKNKKKKKRKKNHYTRYNKLYCKSTFMIYKSLTLAKGYFVDKHRLSSLVILDVACCYL